MGEYPEQTGWLPTIIETLGVKARQFGGGTD
jgi:hypothetical protein